ncbi:MAG: glycosyltransferase family A protein [Gammaproteobacteria bacterium]|nr:glycosyltransferase family A protein [Gammaproteobacteria bacterium]
MDISTVIPVYNGEKYISKAIDSVLEQTIKIDEIIVVDDGSTDKTAEIVQGYGDKVNYYYQKNLGVSAARNKGITIARTDFISFLDHDDMYFSDYIENLYTEFQLDKTLDVAIGKIKYLFENRALQFNEEGLFSHSISSALFKSNVFSKIGFFDETIISSEDLDILLRMKTYNLKINSVDKVCLAYRIHNESVTHSERYKKQAHKDRLYVLKKFNDSKD